MSDYKYNNFNYDKAISIPIIDILNYYNIEIKNNKICCLFHDDQHPSAYIYEDRNWIKCFSCDKQIYGGINIVMLKENYTFLEAIKFLANDFVSNSKFTYTEQNKVDVKSYYAINNRLKELFNMGKNKELIIKYSQMIDLNNRNNKLMLRLYGKFEEMVNRG